MILHAASMLRPFLPNTTLCSAHVSNWKYFLKFIPCEIYLSERKKANYGTHLHSVLLGIRIRSEGLTQVMTKRNASEYIIGSIQRYPRAILSSPG